MRANLTLVLAPLQIASKESRPSWKSARRSGSKRKGTLALSEVRPTEYDSL